MKFSPQYPEHRFDWPMGERGSRSSTLSSSTCRKGGRVGSNVHLTNPVLDHREQTTTTIIENKNKIIETMSNDYQKLRSSVVVGWIDIVRIKIFAPIITAELLNGPMITLILDWAGTRCGKGGNDYRLVKSGLVWLTVYSTAAIVRRYLLRQIASPLLTI